MIKRILSRINRDKPFVWQSYPSLVLIFFSGLAMIVGAFYVFNEIKIAQIARLEAESQELTHFVKAHEQDRERIPMPAPPDPAEALRYARKVPIDRELPRLLTDIDQISTMTGIELIALEVDETQPAHQDKVTLFLKELGKLAQDKKEEAESESENIRRRERIFVTDPELFLEKMIGEAQNDEEQTESGVTELPKELTEYIPFGMIRMELEASGTYNQLTNFLRLLASNERLIHVEKWSYDRFDPGTNRRAARSVFHISFKVFYYEQQVEDIPTLPPLEWERTKSHPIIAIPRSWLEDATDIEESNESMLPRNEIESLADQLPVDPVLKD